MALNAQGGGPGIALATLTLGAGIIDQTLYTALIILAVGTSLLAAAWLRAVVHRGLPLRGGEPEQVPAGGERPAVIVAGLRPLVVLARTGGWKPCATASRGDATGK